MKYCIVRPPNVYNVVCPGRFQMYWAAMDMEITFEGKLRRNIEVSQELRSYSKAIDDAMLWPDAWKVKLTVHDLTPNNFNMYAEYYMNGFNAEEVASLEEQQSLSQALSSVVNYFNEVIGETSEIFKEAKKEYDQSKKQMEEVKNTTMDMAGGKKEIRRSQPQKRQENLNGGSVEQISDDTTTHTNAMSKYIAAHSGGKLKASQVKEMSDNYMKSSQGAREVAELTAKKLKEAGEGYSWRANYVGAYTDADRARARAEAEAIVRARYEDKLQKAYAK